jgi:PhnB protein
MKLHAHLNYGGNCEEAFRFYEQHLGARIAMLIHHGEQPIPNHAPTGLHGVLFARLSIGETELLGNDVPPDRFQPMRSAYLSLSVDSTEEAERIYAALSGEGHVFMPMQETFFAFRFGILRDKFGTSWMISHQRPAAAPPPRA